MSWAPPIPTAVLEAARALGLLRADGALDADWFRDPLARVEAVLSAPAQRAALLRLLSELAPATRTVDGAAWHPVGGRFFVTVAPTPAGARVGLATELGEDARVRAHLDVVEANGASIERPALPLALELVVPVGWERPAHAVALSAVRARARLGLGDQQLVLVLEGLDLDGRGPRDRVIDSAASLGGEAELILGLLAEELRASAGPASHLLPLLGQGDGVPPLPFTELVSDGTAWRRWLDVLVSVGAAPRWLGHLVALAGAVPSSSGSGSATDPWRARLTDLGAGASLDLVMKVETPAPGSRRLILGAVLALAQAPVAVDLTLALVAVPLAGEGPLLPLPSVRLALRAAFPAGTPARALSGGLAWQSPPGRLVPELMLEDVTLAGQHYDRLDLADAGSLTAAAAAALAGLLVQLLGPQLGALVGLVPPTSDPAFPHGVDAVALVSRPLSAIAAVHRSALLDPVHGWGHLFAELLALLGLAGSPTGAGTVDDPWRVAVGQTGLLALDLAAWHEGDGALRLGLLAATEPSLWEVRARAALVALELPASGAPHLSLLGGLRLEALLHPPPASLPDVDDGDPALALTVGASGAGLALEWMPGAAATGGAFVRDLSVTIDATTVTVPLLRFPAPAGFSAAALGISAADLDRVLVALAARAVRMWGGPAAQALAGLVGVSAPALRAVAAPALPTVADAAASLPAGSLLADPGGAARAFLSAVVGGATARLPEILGRLQAQSDGDPARGGGVHEDPWRVALVPGFELLAWLSPGGSPERLAAVRARIAAAPDLITLMGAALALAPFVPALSAAMAERSPGALAGALLTLARHFSGGDGVAPLAAQVAPGFASGAEVMAAHADLPSAPAALAQVASQMQAWEGGGPRLVLLLSAPFADRGAWDALLGGAPAPHFDFRRLGEAAPVAVTEVAEHYTADLAFEGAGPAAAEQIERILARLFELVPGTPVTLVAHSATGIAARAAVALQPSRVRGLITLATPFATQPLLPLRDPAVADAVRFLQRLGPSVLGSGPLAASIRWLGAILDGWRPGQPGEPPLPAPFPLAAFGPVGAAPDLGAVPAMAVRARLDQELMPALRAGLLAMADAATPVTPSHLEVGLRATIAADAGTDLHLRADVARVSLTGAPPPPGPAWRLEARAVLRGADGWLAGTPGATMGTGDARVRWAEIGAVLTPGGGVTPIARLHDAGWRAPLADVVELPGPAARALLGAVVTSPAGELAGPRRALLEALEALGLAARDSNGRLALAADGLDALAADAAAFLSGRLGSALAGDRLWRALGAASERGLSLGALELAVEAGRLVARTGEAGLPLGEAVALHATAQLGGPVPGLEAELVVRSFRLAWSSAAGRLTVAVDGWLDPVTLLPATPAEISAAALAIAPRLLLSASLAALLDRELPAGVRLGPLDAILSAPGRAFARREALGGGGTDSAGSGGIDGARLAGLLDILAGLADTPKGPRPGLFLPGGLLLSVTGGPGLADVALATTRPLGPVALELEAHARIDGARDVVLSGRLAARVPLPGDWPSVGIAFTADEHGFALDLLPPGATQPIHIHPFGGLGPLVGEAATLLPAALDELVAALRPPAAPPSGLLAAALRIAAALEIWDESGGFRAHADQLRALAELGLGAVTPAQRGAVAAAAADLFADAGLALPGAFTAVGTALRWTYALPAGAGGGSATLEVDLAEPALAFTLDDLAPAAGMLRAGLAARMGAGGLALDGTLGFALEGLPAPLLRLHHDGGEMTVNVVPLGAGTEAALTVALAPALELHASPTGLRDLVMGWALPLAGRRLLELAGPSLAQNLWTGGPTLGQLLVGAGLLTSPAGPLASPLPAPEAMARGLVRALGVAPAPLSSTLNVRAISTGDHVGLLLSGHHDLDLGGLRATLLFGEPSVFIADADRGLEVLLFSETTGAPELRPRLRLIGCGLGLAGRDGKPLVDEGPLRLEGVRGYLFGTIALDGGDVTVSELGAGVELDGVGLPVGQAASGGSNPVVGSLLGAAGGGGSDAQPVAPAVNVAVWDRGAGLRVTFDGRDGPIWIPVARAFGPIFVDQIGVAATAAPGLEILVDGSVRLGGLLVALDDLTLGIPFSALARPDEWSVDLAGMGVAFSAAGVTVSGALRRGAGQPPRYDGFLLAQVGGRSFTAVGSFAQPSDAAGAFPSLFAFAVVPTPLGGPPMLYVTGLGGGGGYNRALEPPARVTDVEDFILVEAIDDTSLAADPTGALARLSTSVPPRRGSAFLAAGVRFTSYAFVRSTVVAAVELGRGVNVDVLGISRMQLPRQGRTIANVELALHARYSSSERLLSVIAQLTDSSWILDRDCQLTGGFAFCWWFDDDDFVLTLGGYHPDFVKPARYPDIPRLGFNWRVSPGIVIKGEAYFALTSSCVMAGGRLEATYEKGSVRAWFTTHANLLVAWDPFRYDFEIGVSIGASYTLKVCFIKCARVTFSVSIGADLRLRGPALHGTVTVSLAVASVTFDFGAESQRPNYLPSWDAFAAKYLTGAEPVAVRIERGLLTARAPGPPPDGSPGNPFRVAGEVALVTETRMPANRFRVGDESAVSAPGAASLDLAPLGPEAMGIPSTHRLVIGRRQGSSFDPVALGGPLRPVVPVMGRVPEATFRFRPEDDDVPAARTLPAVVGLRLDARAEAHGARPPVRLVDLIASAGRSRALPFAAPAVERLDILDGLGLAAETLAAVAAVATTPQVAAAARRLLSAEPAAVAARVGAGLPPDGPGASALAGLRRRSAPPMIVPLAAGLARRSPALAAPPPRVVTSAAPPPLREPRLRAVLTAPPSPTRELPPRRTTRVSAALAGNAPRIAAPKGSATSGLERVAAASAPRPTRAASTGRSWQSGELGAAVAPAARAVAVGLEKAIGDRGVTLPSGTTHVWDMPPEGFVVEARGTAALRLTFLGQGGAVLADRELTATSGAVVEAPAGTRSIAATCLGVSPREVKQPGPGAVTAHAAPAGEVIATGWELSHRIPLVGPGIALGRGACVLLGGTGRGSGPRLVALADLLGGPAAVETQLPPGTSLVLILLDELDPTAAASGDLRITVTGGALAGPVGRASAARRRALLYEVTKASAEVPLAVSIASARGFAAAGVIALAGRAADWAARLDGGIPDGLVPDDPLTAYGEVTLRLRPGAPS